MGIAASSLMALGNYRTVTPLDTAAALHRYGQQSVALEGSETATSSPIYLNGKCGTADEHAKKSKELYEGPNQVQRFVQLCKDNMDDVAVSYRDVERVEKQKQEGKDKELAISHMSERHTITYSELYSAIVGFSRGLAELGLPRRCNVSIYEETRWEWLATIYGIWMQDMVASTVYANLGEDALFYALRETECGAIVCNGRSVPLLLQGVQTKQFPACTIIYLGEAPSDELKDTHGCRVVSWAEVVALGNSDKGQTHTAEPPTDNDVTALIMYTSGTTGNPKGVVHTHGSIVSGFLALDDWLYSCTDARPDDSYLAYLPLAHIMEFGVVNILMARRTHVAFGSPRTLTDATTKPHGDLTEVKPSFLVGVPRVFDTLKKAVESQLPPAGSLQRAVFDRAFRSRLAYLKAGKDTPFWNEHIFTKTRAALGGRVRAMLCGGGPLSSTTQDFVNVVFGPIVVGWGLTETICVGAIQRLGDMTTGCTGQVLLGEELKLVDSGEYKHTDSPRPRGEICVRGPFLFRHYYKQEDETKEAFDSEGWFHTGDVGSIDEKGRLYIGGRLKALAKNAVGEYIAMEQLEAIYAEHPLVANDQLCVLVDSGSSYIAAIAVTSEGKVKKYAAEHHIDGEFPDLLQSDELTKAVLADLEAKGTEAKRQKFEMVRKILLVDDEWSPEKGQLTAAMKLKRSTIQEQYKDEIEELFKD